MQALAFGEFGSATDRKPRVAIAATVTLAVTCCAAARGRSGFPGLDDQRFQILTDLICSWPVQ